jgi:hypothetical protein
MTDSTPPTPPTKFGTDLVPLSFVAQHLGVTLYTAHLRMKAWGIKLNHNIGRMPHVSWSAVCYAAEHGCAPKPPALKRPRVA